MAVSMSQPVSSDQRKIVMGRRLGVATLFCAVLGIFGSMILPLLVQLLETLDLLTENISFVVLYMRAWTGPGTLIAIVIGAVGVWGFRSKLALFGVMLALIPVVMALATRMSLYLISHFA